MNSVVETMRLLPDFYPAKGASAEDIDIAEERLKLTFSDEYREYIKAFGDASANGHELTGISDSARIDVVSVTLAERARNPGVPTELYVVEQTHVDRIAIWQDAHGSIYQTIPGGKPEKIYESLSAYIVS
ncbi:cell wall assembly/cell proliferation coordinating protein, KNR4-like protein [Eggerthellaceae bacterium zg-887]|uniref:SMI1/KNR4 family protein n=1 Tax=Xiamenia xianingshaonis TaxID=2682776 RepID=UPI00140DED7C|nr:SMI1/KNR4 family protein [Xiamenia xianingshaonis]NHM16219.1 cell wall assembly/cell proliferation coordinating protein, KNR4-like protein [Xiamenia xianingshaonis]